MTLQIRIFIFVPWLKMAVIAEIFFHIHCEKKPFCFSFPPAVSGPWKETFCVHKCWKSLPVPGMRHFTFLHAIKIWSLEGDLAWGPEFSGMGECNRSHSGDQKTFPAFGNAEDLLPEEPEDSGRLFHKRHGKKATA
jgi:hypothetical protein